MNKTQRILIVVAMAFATMVGVALLVPVVDGRSLGSTFVRTALVILGGIVVWAVVSYVVLDSPLAELGLEQRVASLEEDVEELQDEATPTPSR